MPGAHPYLDSPAPLAFAHRGGGAERPENTYAAFAHAVELGYRYVETDVHATADGVVAVLHDPSLDRIARRPGRIRELRWAEVAAAELADGQRVPRLDELLEHWPDLRFNIDAKDPAVAEPLARVLQRAGALHRVCVTSFSDRRVAKLRRLLGPGLCTAMGRRQVATLRLSSLLPRPPGRPGPAARAALGMSLAAQVPLRSGCIPIAGRRFITAAHSAGLQVHVWTLDDAPTMARALALGADGIMTDRPTALKELLEARGAWPG